mmetsp:Transcript_66570/g.150287  ORF Transcript_66570/g.150287 Transcript_66570/m.150287 type:complete len:310 (+) Transcript_66570:257-1186(+)
MIQTSSTTPGCLTMTLTARLATPIGKPAGLRTRRQCAARTLAEGAPCRPQQIRPTTARPGTPTGSRAGPPRRRPGAAARRTWDAPPRRITRRPRSTSATASPPRGHLPGGCGAASTDTGGARRLRRSLPPRLLPATLALPTGWPAGRTRRRSGAALTSPRAAPRHTRQLQQPICIRPRCRSSAAWVPQTGGLAGLTQRNRGAVLMGAGAAFHRKRPELQSRMTATWGSPTGRRDGPSRRKDGAVSMATRAARSRSTATWASPTGRPAGPWARRSGAAITTTGAASRGRRPPCPTTATRASTTGRPAGRR